MTSEKRILIVEDADEIRESIAELLGSEGYDVLCAQTGRDAFKILESTNPLPKLILLDLMMPDMDGYAFRALQESDPQLRGIPVLLMTASSDLATRASDLRVEGYLKKPFQDLDTILRTIAKFFAEPADQQRV